jgi:hypothetical protein
MKEYNEITEITFFKSSDWQQPGEAIHFGPSIDASCPVLTILSSVQAIPAASPSQM